MSSVDVSSPFFVVQVLSQSPAPRLITPNLPGSGLAHLTNAPGSFLDKMVDVSTRVESFEYVDAEREVGRLVLTVDNFDLYFFSTPAWVRGNLVRFFWGYPGKIQGPKFAVVDGFRGYRKLQVSCLGRESLANVAINRPWINTTRVGIIATLVSEGAFPGVTKVEVEDAVPATIPSFFVTPEVGAIFGSPKAEKPRDFTQAAQTDWQFALRLAEDVGYELYVEDDVLHFHARKLNVRPIKKFEWYTGAGDIKDFDIEEFRVLDRPLSIDVRAFDPISRKEVSATGSNEDTKRDTLGKQGASALNTFLRGASGKLAASKVVLTPRSDQETVSNIADSTFRLFEQAEVTASMTTIGDPDLKKARLVKVAGVDPMLAGNYYLQEVAHKIDRGGYSCHCKMWKNALTRTPESIAPVLDPATTKDNEQSPAEGSKKRLVQQKPGTLLVQGS